MASPLCNAQSEPAKVEQIITEFFTKSLHIILESRSPYVSSRNYYSGDISASSPSSSSSTSSIRPRDKWFNLALRDCPSDLENLDLWRQSNLEPLVVDVILVRRPLNEDRAHPPLGGCLVRNLSAKDRYPNCWSTGQDELVSETRSEKIIERWIVQYESRKSGCNARDLNSGGKRSSGSSYHSSEMSAAHKKTYKRSIVLLRSLYVTVRLLPAYKIFRDLNSSGQIRSYSLAHRISSFVEPFTRVEDAEMNQFGFVPVDTPCGRLCLSVSYLPTLESVSSEPSTPLSTQFISDYVGSPLTDPLKRFQSLPLSGPLPTHVSFSRCHSWSNDHGATPSVSPSPSSTYSDSRDLHSNLHPDLLPPCSHITIDNSPSKSSVSHNVSLDHKKTISFDEYWPSPPISPSLSPSPPTHLSSRNSLNALTRTESDPVRIPLVRRNSGLPIHALPPSPSSKGTRPRCSFQADSVRAQASTACASQASPSESRFQVKQETTRLGEIRTGITLPKVSFLDEFDDSKFVCPFADDEDIRIDPSDGKGQVIETSESGGMLTVRKSQDAAVGELVRMLKAAPPLRQDFSNSVKFSEASQDVETTFDLENAASGMGVSALGLLKSRTASDALEELRNYREMKDMLLSQGGSTQLDVNHAANPGGGSSEV